MGEGDDQQEGLGTGEGSTKQLSKCHNEIHCLVKWFFFFFKKLILKSSLQPNALLPGRICAVFHIDCPRPVITVV